MNDLCPCCHEPLPEMDMLVVSLDENCIVYKGVVCQLTPIETEIMYCLDKGAPEYTDVGRIYLAVWGASDPPNDSSLRAHFSHMRDKFVSSMVDIKIESAGVRGGGMHKYRLRYGN